jgi:hypothetical protein
VKQFVFSCCFLFDFALFSAFTSAMAERCRTASETEAEIVELVENVHPASARILRKAPFLGYVPVFNITFKKSHHKFVFAICMQRLFAKGLAHGLKRLSIQPMLSGRYGLTKAMYKRLSTL